MTKPSKRRTLTTARRKPKPIGINGALKRYWLTQMNRNVQDLLVTLRKLYELSDTNPPKKPKRRKIAR